MPRKEPILFDPQKHEYRCGGILVPSVTDILGDHIADYSFSTEDARKAGDVLHKITFLYDCGTLKGNSVDRRMSPFLSAWKQFQKEWRVEFRSLEEIVFCRLSWFAGRLDRVASVWDHRLGARRTVIIDIKKGKAPKWTALQTAGYGYAKKRYWNWARMAVELYPDGTYQAKEYPAKDFRRDLAYFLAAQKMMIYKKIHNLKRER